MFSPQLRAQIVKEMLSLLRDKRVRMILIVPPILQLILFAYALTYDVKNVHLIVLNKDRGYWSQQYLAAVGKASFVTRMSLTDNPETLRATIERREALAAIQIPEDFSRTIAAGGTGTVQVIIDGRRANAGQVAGAYLQMIAQQVGGGTSVDDLVSVRYWFNPTLNYKWFVVPGLAGILAFILTLVTAALTIAREREMGTFDQLLVSPCSTYQIIVAKLVPPFVVGAVMSFFMYAAAVFLFSVPFVGSFVLLLLAMALFILSIAGIGLVISSICATQQQAIVGVFVMMVPIVLISGFATPIENMPVWLQYVSWGSPFRHYLVVLHGAFLKGMPALDMLSNMWPMAVIAAVTLVFATVMVKSRLQ